LMIEFDLLPSSPLARRRIYRFMDCIGLELEQEKENLFVIVKKRSSGYSEAADQHPLRPSLLSYYQDTVVITNKLLCIFIILTAALSKKIIHCKAILLWVF